MRLKENPETKIENRKRESNNFKTLMFLEFEKTLKINLNRLLLDLTEVIQRLELTSWLNKG